MDQDRDQSTDVEPEVTTEPLPVPEEALASRAEDSADPYAREAAIDQLTAPGDRTD